MNTSCQKPWLEAGGVRVLREGLGWTKAELARRIGVSSRTVIRWEMGHVVPQGAGAKALEILWDRLKGRKA